MTKVVITDTSYKTFTVKRPLFRAISCSRVRGTRSLVTGRNEVVAKVVFTRVCDSVHRGGSPGRPPLAGRTPPDLAGPPLAGRTPPPGPGRETPGTRQTPPRQVEPPQDLAGRPPQDLAWRPPWDQADPPPPPGRRLQHTVNERPVRILLECILVYLYISLYKV